MHEHGLNSWTVQFKEEWWLYYPTKCSYSVYLMWVIQVQPLLPHGYEAIHFTVLLMCHWEHSKSFIAAFCQYQNYCMAVLLRYQSVLSDHLLNISEQFEEPLWHNNSNNNWTLSWQMLTLFLTFVSFHDSLN